MNDTPNTPDDIRNELHDRLAELALAEALGGKRPPDLVERIVAAAEDRPRPAWRRPRMALAASLLLLVGVLGGSIYAYKVRQRAVAGGNIDHKLVAIVDDYNKLMDERRYAEAEVLSKQAVELAPEHPVARQIAREARLIRNYNNQLAIRDPREDAVVETLAAVPERSLPFGDVAGSSRDYTIHKPRYENAAPGPESRESGEQRHKQVVDELAEIEHSPTPTPGEPAIEFPEAQQWSDLTNRRSLAAREKKREAEDKSKKVYPVADLVLPVPGKDKGQKGSGAQNQPESSDRDRLTARAKLSEKESKYTRESGRQGRGGEGEDRPTNEALATDEAPLAKQASPGEERRTESLALMATPRVIIEQEEDELLGIIPESDRGRGPGEGGDRYSRIIENQFLAVKENPLSTFSIDVDTASYTKVRRYIEQNHMLPPPDAVRIEEFVNYFSYDYAPPADDKPFAAAIEVAACPWRPAHRLVRVGLKGREIARDKRPTSNLVFLLDVSGSMEPEDKLPRVRRAMRMLVDQLGENDRVAIAVYAGASGLVLPSTPGTNKDTIVASLDSLHAGGSTNGASGIQLAYDTATANFIKGGTNRVILCTDGDFNVGTTSTGDLERLIEEKAKTGVFLTVLGFGMGNHNDDMLEKLADKGNGNYGYIDSEEEARKMLVEELGATLVTIAKDVKLQVEFNPAQVAAYRLVGYENRILAAEDFNDDKKDAGEIGAGHTVTALYEVIPVTADAQPAEPVRQADPLRYQKPHELTAEAAAGELLSLKIRYKDPDADKSHEPLVFPVKDTGNDFGKASADFKFAAAVASYAMLLRGSQFRGDTSLDAVLEIAQGGIGPDKHGYRAAFLKLVQKTKALGK